MKKGSDIVPIALGFAALLLTGCASTRETLARPADTVLTSRKPARDVAQCLAILHDVPVREREDGSMLVQVTNIWGAPGMSFVVHDQGSGSRIEIRETYSALGDKGLDCY